MAKKSVRLSKLIEEEEVKSNIKRKIFPILAGAITVALVLSLVGFAGGSASPAPPNKVTATNSAPGGSVDATIDRSPGHGCTGAMALGLTSAKGNMVAESCDWTVPPGPCFPCMGAVELVE